jgi:hypothetical protein
MRAQSARHGEHPGQQRQAATDEASLPRCVNLELKIERCRHGQRKVWRGQGVAELCFLPCCTVSAGQGMAGEGS